MFNIIDADKSNKSWYNTYMERSRRKKMKIPRGLQSVLWSTNINLLDVERDKGYIIHQIFAYGRMEDILWVFKTYPKREIIKTFTSIPYKDYRAGRFNFVKNYLLDLKNYKLDDRYYVKNIPRALG